MSSASATDGQGTPPARVTRDDPVYRPDAGEEAPHFFRDLANLVVHRDPRVFERLRRHNLALGGGEVRDSGSGAYGGIVVPQFLTGMAAGPVRAGDPLVKSLEIIPLPASGVSFTVPRSATTGGSTAASVTSENTAVAETDPAIVNIDRTIVTVAGQVTVSGQYINRGTSVTETYLVRDLQEAVDTAIDSQLINGTGTNGQLLGLRNVTDRSTITWTDTNPTRTEFTRYTAQAATSANNARLLPPDTIVMHGRRWHWLLGAGTAADDYDTITHTWLHGEYLRTDGPTPFVGSLAQMSVVVDNNIPTTVGSATNEDVVLVIRRRDMPLHLGPMMVDVHRQTEAGSLEVNLVAWRYAVWFPDRYRGTSTAVLTGSGLATPAF